MLLRAPILTEAALAWAGFGTNLASIVRTFDFKSELVRGLVLLGATLWLLHPFLTARFVGTGDAAWYANMLADFVLQLRAGDFPVFAGQTEYAFNGAVYPLRVAPLYQHLAGAIDLITGRQLGWFALQHACVIVAGLGGAVAAYVAIRLLAPAEKWTAVGFALLYIGCPGVLGLIYTQDLYMSWMTLPFLPLVAAGFVLSFERNDLCALLILVASLSALWFAHTPIALWATLVVGVGQLLRLTLWQRDGKSWRRALVAAAVFAALTHYPFVSVASLSVPGSASAVPTGFPEPERIMIAIREVFPAVLRPLSENARALSDLQLGYALWLVLLGGGVISLRRGAGVPLRFLVVAVAVLLALILPVPGVTEPFWNAAPETLKRITYYWPMQRFLPISAAFLAVAGAVGLGTAASAWRKSLLAVLAMAVGWTLWEARQFVRAGTERTASSELTQRSARLENRPLMNHAYGFLPAVPDYFSNGVMDPVAESRLLDAATREPLAPRGTPAFATWRAAIDVNPGIVRLAPGFTLQPGRRYELIFEFAQPDAIGVLQLAGATFFREYVLPHAGRPRAFGSGAENGRRITLWTTGREAEDIVVRFIPTGPNPRPRDHLQFGRYAFRELPAAEEPVQLAQLMPYTARTRSPTNAWLETPRVFVPSYRATVDGHDVAVDRSPQGLVMVPVGAGEHDVTVRYRAPGLVQFSYWATGLAWLALFVGAGWSRRKQVTN